MARTMPDSDKVNILLVDDQPARLLSYEAILRDLGQVLVKVTSGVGALECLMRDEFAVILLDVSMPGMDGFETATLIHQHPRFEKTPIIFVTAMHVTDLDQLKGYALGAVDYVYVPVVPEILRSKVSVLVELHLKRRELQRLNRSLEETNLELAAANSTLQAEKTRELERLNGTLEEANVGLAQANRTLQAEVVERERLEVALRETDRRKDEFLAILAHELRNPLAPIMNALHLMRLSRFEDSELLWCRDVIGRQVEYLIRLVDDLLDVSRITQGKIKLKKEPIDLESVVTRAIEIMRPLLESRNHELTVELPDEPVMIDGDLTRLAQVVGNLLSNAAKYTEDEGKILLQVECEGEADAGEALIRVKDSGAGIPRALLPKVFDLFTQVEHTLDRAQGGLGIGLALVRRLVEMHDGSVTAESEGEGRGSEFVVRLPVLPRSVQGQKTEEAAEGRPPAGPFRRVLVADDNVDSALTLATLLRSAGNEVETAHDGLEAWDAAQKIRPDLVLLDLGMPGLDGCSVARRIRSQPWGQKPLLIALTGWGQEDVRVRTDEAGFDAHLVKPVDFDVLTRLLADRAAQRSNSSHAPDAALVQD